MPIPSMIRDANKELLEEVENLDKENVAEETRAENEETVPDVKKTSFDAALDAYVNGYTAMQLFFKKAGEDAVGFVGDFFRDKSVVVRQQMFYGILKLYDGDLENFMQG